MTGGGHGEPEATGQTLEGPQKKSPGQKRMPVSVGGSLSDLSEGSRAHSPPSPRFR